MRHKNVRLLYMVVVYILAMPVFMGLLLLGLLWMCVICIRDHYSFDEFKDLLYAGLYGLKSGHAINVHFVKYGYDKNYYGWEEKEL